jgi:hypothetical protein
MVAQSLPIWIGIRHVALVTAPQRSPEQFYLSAVVHLQPQNIATLFQHTCPQRTDTLPERKVPLGDRMDHVTGTTRLLRTMLIPVVDLPAT